MGVDAREFPGGLLRLNPPLRMSSLLPHDLCHGRSASRRPPTLGLIFCEACLLPPAPEGVLCGKKKTSLSPREFGRENLYAWWVKFPFDKFLPPPTHRPLLTEDLVIVELQFKSECDCDQTQ